MSEAMSTFIILGACTLLGAPCEALCAALNERKRRPRLYRKRRSALYAA